MNKFASVSVILCNLTFIAGCSDPEGNEGPRDSRSELVYPTGEIKKKLLNGRTRVAINTSKSVTSNELRPIKYDFSHSINIEKASEVICDKFALNSVMITPFWWSNSTEISQKIDSRKGTFAFCEPQNSQRELPTNIQTLGTPDFATSKIGVFTISGYGFNSEDYKLNMNTVTLFIQIHFSLNKENYFSTCDISINEQSDSLARFYYSGSHRDSTPSVHLSMCSKNGEVDANKVILPDPFNSNKIEITLPNGITISETLQELPLK